MDPFITAILLMGGEGKRLQSTTPKQLHRLSGKKIYLHTLERFVQTQLFQEILLVCHESCLEEVKKETQGVRVVLGGATRQESSYLGLLACDPRTTFVVIHDAVRPFVSETIVRANVEKVQRFHAVDTCIPSADTIVHSKEGSAITSIPKRSEYLRGQTPQSFSYPLILEAHQHARKQRIFDASDDCSLVLNLGKSVHIVEGEEHNIKITTELDLFLAEQLFRVLQSRAPQALLKDLKGKRIAITGGSGGIGQAIADLLKEEGAIPLLLSRSSPSYPVDLTSPEQTASIFEKIGPIDGLINSIGLFKRSMLEHLTFAEIDALIRTNLTSVIYSCKCAHIHPGGHIINIASSSYTRGRKEYAIYSSAKAAVVNFTQGLADERPELCIHALVPPRTATPMRSLHFPEDPPSTLLDPKDVAKTTLSLLKQPNVTGCIVPVVSIHDCVQ